jgi:hypothetical protein
MCKPTVTSAVSSTARIAAPICASQARAASRLGGCTQFEFSLPTSHAQSASWPASAAATSESRRAWASATSGSAYQWRSPDSTTMPPETTRKRASPSERPSAHAGIQFTPLMWPVNSVGTSDSPSSPARSATMTSRSTIARSTSSGAGWKSSRWRLSARNRLRPPPDRTATTSPSPCARASS